LQEKGDSPSEIPEQEKIKSGTAVSESVQVDIKQYQLPLLKGR
jgi:hypothetical protein